MHELSAFELTEDRAERRGEIRALRQTLLALGRTKIGTPEPGVVSALEEISDLERLERMTIRVLTADNWTELLATE